MEKKKITKEHVDNNSSVRNMLGNRGIKPENLKQAEDLKKLERRVKQKIKSWQVEKNCQDYKS